MKYRSGLEKKAAVKLRGWEYEPFKRYYKTQHSYTPDFVNGRVLIECKGFFRAGDTQKYKAIRDSLVDEELVFLLEKPNTKVRKGAKLTMAQWCDKEGFSWYTLDTIEDLLNE